MLAILILSFSITYSTGEGVSGIRRSKLVTEAQCDVAMKAGETPPEVARLARGGRITRKEFFCVPVPEAGLEPRKGKLA